MPSVPAPDLGNGRHRPGPYPAASATLVRRRLPGHHPHAGLLGVAAAAPARARPLRVRLASPTSRPGCSAPTTASAPSTCPTTSTNSSSASTDAAPPWRRSNPCWARPSGTPRPPTRCCMLLSQPDRHFGSFCIKVRNATQAISGRGAFARLPSANRRHAGSGRGCCSGYSRARDRRPGCCAIDRP